MLQDAVLRMRDGQEIFSPPILLANHAHQDLLAAQLCAAGVDPVLVILEPMPKNTAPAIAALAIAAEQENSGEILVVLPADHAIADDVKFRETLVRGAPAARDGAIVTFGVEPTRPETGYGYILSEEAVDGEVRKVAAFVEKPDLATAEKYVASGDYFWNAGIFMFRSDVMIGEMKKHCPKILAAAEASVSKAVKEGPALLLDAEAFGAAPEDSIDYAVIEHTDKAVVLPIAVGWSDIGSWATLWDIADKDENGNASRGGEALFLNCADNLAMSGGPKIAAIGVENLLIVATADGVLVANRDDAQAVKQVFQSLKDEGLTELL